MQRGSMSAARRRMKLEMYMGCVKVPPRFAVMAQRHSDEIINDVAIVCDGGFDNRVPQSPPPNKVNDHVYTSFNI